MNLYVPALSIGTIVVDDELMLLVMKADFHD